MLRPLIQHRLRLSVGLLQRQGWLYSSSLPAFCSSQLLSQMFPSLYALTDSSHNCHFVGFVMQTKSSTCYNDLFALPCDMNYTSNTFLPPRLYVCRERLVCSLHAVCGLSLSSSQCSSGRGECVVWLPYPLSPALISALLSPVLSWLLVAVQA